MNCFIRMLVLILILILSGCEGDTIQEVVSPAVPDRIQIGSGDNLVGVVGTRSIDPLAVKVLLSDGAPAENVQVIFKVEEGDATVETDLAISDKNGIALTFLTFGTSAGFVEVSASAYGLKGSPLTFNAMGVAADASILVRVSGNDQSTTVGQQLPQPIVVRAEDMYGNPTPEVTVVFSVTGGGGTVGEENVQTGTDGIASTSWILGTVAGTQTVQVTAQSLSGFPVFFSAAAQPDSPAALVIASGDNQGGITGQPLDEPLVALVTDQHSNPVSEVRVYFSVTAGDGTVDPDSSTTDDFGKASTILTLGSAGNHQVTASIGSVAQNVFHATAFSPIVIQSLTTSIDGIEINWSMNVNPGFESYEVYRSTIPPVTRSSTLITTIENEAQTTYKDQTVTLGTLYFYRVFVTFGGGMAFGSNEESATAGLLANLSEVGFDMEFDPVRDQIYVSLPSLNSIVTLSATTFQQVSTDVVGTRPQGISLSSDGERLYCALNTAGSVAAWLIGTATVDQIIIGTELDDPRTYDVLEVNPDVLLVTSSPSSNGFAYVVKVNIDFVNGHTAQRVASNRIIRARPTLAKSGDGTRAYVGEGFSPNSLYKLDMTQPSAPIILEDDHGSVSGTDRLEVSPDFTRIYLRSGQVLQTSDFNQIGSIGYGVPRLSSDGSLCYVGTSSEVQVWRTDTYLQVDGVSIPYGVNQMLVLPSKGYIAVLAGSHVFAIPIP